MLIKRTPQIEDSFVLHCVNFGHKAYSPVNWLSGIFKNSKSNKACTTPKLVPFKGLSIPYLFIWQPPMRLKSVQFP